MAARPSVEELAAQRAQWRAVLEGGGAAAALRSKLKHYGLPPNEQNLLVRGGVTSGEIFDLLEEEDFAACGIDIGERRYETELFQQEVEQVEVLEAALETERAALLVAAREVSRLLLAAGLGEAARARVMAEVRTREDLMEGDSM